VVIAVYAGTAHSGLWESLTGEASANAYNLLVQGFRAGQLDLKVEVPPGLAELADPYDPVASAHFQGAFYRLHDLSYYKGKFHLYFGVTPALLLFWPHVILTGHYLFYRRAVAIFCVLGYLVTVGVLCAMWRRYFCSVSVWVVAACALALGLATGMPVLLARCSVYEVPIGCGYMLTMLAVGAIWRALHNSGGRLWWLVVPSTAYGLVLATRPSLLFGAIILLIPVAQARCEGRRMWPLLAALISPMIVVGLGLMIYNARRFGHPLEFGWRYALTGNAQMAHQGFSPRYVGFNLQAYLLQPVKWGNHFPFMNAAPAPPVPAGHGLPEDPFGILFHIPLVWLAAVAPLAWRYRTEPARSTIRWFLLGLVLLLAGGALVLGIFFAACARYEMELLPALVLLAVIGVLGLERTFAREVVWRRGLRCVWGLLLGWSIAFNVLASVEHRAEAEVQSGLALMELGKVTDAIWHLTEAVRLDPDYAIAHNELGYALEQSGRIREAIDQYEQAVRIRPEMAEAHYNLGNALVHTHELDAAIGQYQEAMRLEPNHRELHYNFGEVLLARGRVPEAIGQFEKAVQIDPAYADAHNRLAAALAQSGRLEDAIAHFEEAIRLDPRLAAAENGLANVLLLDGRTGDAIHHYERALRLTPDSATTHCNLASALEGVGRVQEAREQYRQALRLKPDLAAAEQALSRLEAVNAPGSASE
jgi:tetratricopeptide (TPR) repeat protein